jgi:hypothetical protein
VFMGDNGGYVSSKKPATTWMIRLVVVHSMALSFEL